MMKAALLSILSKKAYESAISAVKGTKEATGKTQEIVKLLSKIAPAGKILLVVEPGQSKFKLGVRNIRRATLVTTSSLNTYQVTVSPRIIFTTEALTAFVAKYEA